MISISVSNDSTTVTLSYTAPTPKINATLLDCAHYLWDMGYGDHGTIEKQILFSSLTNVQKLSLVDDFVRRTLRDAAKTYHLVSAQNTAKTTAEEENEALYL